MKILEPRLIQEYICEYCRHKPFLKKHACIAHENKCYKNPNRNCPTCENKGAIDEIMNNGYYGHLNMDCPSCKIAESVGGKSYTKHLIS